MRVLVACEESQAVCIEFRKRGHEAYSCDIQDCSGGHPEWHLKTDVMYMLKEPKWFTDSKPWDMLIAFPPCTYVCFAGIHWNVGNPERREKTDQAIEFFKRLYYSGIPKICIENPVGVIPRLTGIKSSQIIHPWMFGDGEMKKTCLWLKGLPPLKWTDKDTLFENKTTHNGRTQRVFKMAPGPDRAKLRSKTFPGIAKAMAEQWG